jgi:predicted secreted protein
VDIVRSGTALRLHPRLRQVFIELPKMINPGVQNSSAPHWNHDVTNISEPQRVLAQEFAIQVKVHTDN